MAFETETTQNVPILDRISKGLEGAMKGINFAQQFAQTQQAMKLADAQKELVTQAYQQKRAEMQDFNTQRVGRSYMQAIRSGDIDNYFKASAPQIQDMISGAGINMSIDGMTAAAKRDAADPARAKAWADIEQAQKNLSGFKPGIDNADIFSKNVKLRDDAYGILKQDAMPGTYDIYDRQQQQQATTDLKVKEDISKYENQKARIKQLGEIAQTKAEAQRNAALAKTEKEKDAAVYGATQEVVGLKRTGANGQLQTSNSRVQYANDGLRQIKMLKSGDVKSTRSVEIELARTIDGLVTKGSQGSAELVKEMLNKTGWSASQSIAEWLSSSPKNHLPDDFVTNVKQQILGQKSFWEDEQVRNIQAKEEALQPYFEGPGGDKRKQTFLSTVKRFAPHYKSIDEDPRKTAQENTNIDINDLFKQAGIAIGE